MHSGAFLIGFLAALVLCGAVVLSVLMRYVSTDLDGFKRYLDHVDPPAV